MKGANWIKITTNMFEDEKIRLINAMKNSDPIYCIWLKLLLQAGKVNDGGLIYLKENVAYSKEMLSIIFNRPIEIINEALKVLEDFQMIEIYENNIIKISNWEKHQNIEGMQRAREKTRNRVKNCREKKKNENNVSGNFESDVSNKEKSFYENADCDKSNTEFNDTSEEKNCNANVTVQREKESKKKNKKIDKEEREENSLLDSEFHENLSLEATELINSVKDLKINIKGFTLNSVIAVLSVHSEEYVKMAVQKAIEKNKFDMNYVDGILNNWLREGYPKISCGNEVKFSKENNVVTRGKPKLRFNNFEGREYDYKELEKGLLGWGKD